MKRKYLLLLSVLLIGLIVNSCKKSGVSPIKSLFTDGTWELASVFAFNYIGSQQTSVDTLNAQCDTLTQFFTFNDDNTCTYTNYSCQTQSAKGNWSLTENQLFLASDMVCKSDTVTGGTLKPFANTQIINLGQYSLVLQTGDIAPNYSLTKRRRILQYGFVRQNKPAGN